MNNISNKKHYFGVKFKSKSKMGKFTKKALRAELN
jgi:hypothetical protein